MYTNSHWLESIQLFYRTILHERGNHKIHIKSIFYQRNCQAVVLYFKLCLCYPFNSCITFLNSSNFRLSTMLYGLLRFFFRPFPFPVDIRSHVYKLSKKPIITFILPHLVPVYVHFTFLPHSIVWEARMDWIGLDAQGPILYVLFSWNESFWCSCYS